MPGPDPHTIWIEPVIGGSLITYARYLGTGKAGNRKKRVAMIGERLSRSDWICRWCLDPMPIWKRAHALYCLESCRKRVARSRKRNTWVSISS